MLLCKVLGGVERGSGQGSGHSWWAMALRSGSGRNLLGRGAPDLCKEEDKTWEPREANAEGSNMKQPHRNGRKALRMKGPIDYTKHVLLFTHSLLLTPLVTLKMVLDGR